MSLLRSSLRALSAPKQAIAASVRSVSAADGGKVVKQEASTAGEIDPESQSLKAAKAAGTPLLHSSTSALDYKLQKHSSASYPPALPVFTPSNKTAEDHVLSILYNTPPPSTEPYKRHILNCLVQDEPGVLSRVSSTLAGRGFNIDSLVVCRTEIRDLSRMCIVLRGQDGTIEQARRTLEDLVPVWAVLDYTNTNVIQRELLLVKLSTLGPEYVESQISSGPSLVPQAQSSHSLSDLPTQGGEQTAAQAASEHSAEALHQQQLEQQEQAQFEHQQNLLSHSEALIRQGQHLAAIQSLSTQFGGRTVDISAATVTIELTGKSERIDAFLSLIRPYGVLEAARSGAMVMPRTPIPKHPSDLDEVSSDAYVMDASLLPPG